MRLQRYVAINGMLAAVYAVMTVITSAIAYGPIQFRFSEILLFFAFYNRRYIPGLAIGTLLANLYSPAGFLDVLMGSVATIIVCCAIYLVKSKYWVPVIAAIVNGAIVGWMLYLVFEVPMMEAMWTVALGEFVVVVVGLVIFKLLANHQQVMKLLKDNDPKWN